MKFSVLVNMIGISRKRVGHIIHEFVEMKMFCTECLPRCWSSLTLRDTINYYTNELRNELVTPPTKFARFLLSQTQKLVLCKMSRNFSFKREGQNGDHMPVSKASQLHTNELVLPFLRTSATSTIFSVEKMSNNKASYAFEGTLCHC